MIATKAHIALYAENEEEVRNFEQTFFEFVDNNRAKGVAITAGKMERLIREFGNNPMLLNLLK
jgi:hypothetical protein